ncbi:MAG: histidinol-phosphatase [Verrucomicrobia bacterium]|nr:histidinol-phosphatase [Verrucomicrobiota bacterium]
MIADWYKSKGYHFLALSDHNLIQTGEKWINVGSLKEGAAPLSRCEKRFGTNWLARRWVGPVSQVRLKTLAEFRPLLEEPGRFLLIPATEITARYSIWPVHVNAANLKHPIAPPNGLSVLDVLQRSFDAVYAQRQATRQPILPHVNHPNFGWAITAEDLMRLRGGIFFEVYNGHPEVHNFGDGTRQGTEAMWDIALSFRLTQTKLGPLYGLAVDDSHRYHIYSPEQSNPGRGWVIVRALRLDPNDLIPAMERGDFYSSSGVELEDVTRLNRTLTVAAKPRPGETLTIRFIGTPKRFNPSSEPIIAKDGRPYPTTRRYRPEIGNVLQESQGPTASYTLKGDELYVRATIISSFPKKDAKDPSEKEMAWVQPWIQPLQ